MTRPTLVDALPILRCPRTGSALRLAGSALIADDGTEYEIVDGIANLVDESTRSCSPQMEAEYDSAARLLYDLWVGNPLFMSVVWGIGVLKTPLKVPKMLDVEDGWVLDVPCGTGLYSSPVMRSNSNARFIGVDYSLGMLKAAQARYLKQGIENVLLIRADVAKLPFADEVFCGALSLAGFHTFSKPDLAGREIGRALQSDAPLLMTVLCHSVRKVSDFVIDRFMVPRSYFSEPLSPADYRLILEQSAIDHLQVEMAGALMVAKGNKSTLQPQSTRSP